MKQKDAKDKKDEARPVAATKIPIILEFGFWMLDFSAGDMAAALSQEVAIQNFTQAGA